MLDYGIVGNCKTAALIKKDASVDWMCYPTFSSPSVFARLLDAQKGGAFQIKPQGKYQIQQRYLPNTAVLETTFTSPRAKFVVWDFFPRYKKLLAGNYEKLVRQNRLIRIIKPLKGKPKIKIVYEPRPDYARVTPTFEVKEGNLLTMANKERLSLISNIASEQIQQQELLELKTTKYLIVGENDTAADFSVKKCMQLLSATKKYWEDWVNTLVLPEQHKEVIIRSAITLKLLTYSETGAIIAAATTSIPEEIGSERCWDYRYCWVRDAVFCVDALKKIGRQYESKKLLSFIINRALEDDFIQIMYSIHGETQLVEETLPHLAGYKNSRPVRVGNAAFNQIQHDIYGEVLDLMYLYFVYYKFEKRMTRKYWRFVRYVVNQIKFTWHRKDSGIWEFREMYNHYTFSKLMCYVGVDRAIKIAQHFQKEKYIPEWTKLRDEIYESILKQSYKGKAFTIHYDSTDLDASLLLMCYHEFLPATDPHLRSTVYAVYEKLRRKELVQRYTISDDFGRSSSAFTICSFWLVDALYYIGEEEKAREIYNTVLQRANHLGLFSEDIDIKTRKLAGNFPQAYTHIALINSSILLSEWAEKRKRIDWSMIKKKVY